MAGRDIGLRDRADGAAVQVLDGGRGVLDRVAPYRIGGGGQHAGDLTADEADEFDRVDYRDQCGAAVGLAAPGISTVEAHLS